MVLKGYVSVLKPGTRIVTSTVHEGDLFELSEETSKICRYEANKLSKPENDEVLMKDGVQQRIEYLRKQGNTKSVKNEQDLYLQFQMSILVKQLTVEVDIQLNNLIKDMKRFELLQCLNTREIEYLAKQVKVYQYLDNEVIINEGHYPMDHFYLVSNGTVKMEKLVQLQQNHLWPKSKKCWHKLSMVEDVSCLMGEIPTHEQFGLREMLFKEVDKINQLEYLPAQCRYSAKCGKDIAVIYKVSYFAFKNVMPKSEIDRLLNYYDVDYKF